MWLTCMVINVHITTIWWRGLLYDGGKSSRVAQVHGYLPQIAYFTHFL